MIINVTHYKGGVGKTTLSTNLAQAFDAPLLDLDALQGSLNFNKLRKANGHTPLNCFTAKTLEELKDIYSKYQSEILIVDSGGFDSDINRLALVGADILISPVAPSQVELFGLEAFEKVLRQASREYKSDFKTNVVINNADSRSKGMVNKLKKCISQTPEHFDLLEQVIHNRIDFKKAYAEGVSVIELDKESKAAFEIQQLVKEIRRMF
ncbi:Hypothetical protein LUCI_3751 [Lucifera butyrica]|uniref:CobQ/CobB/MinD/ParA nucleotide binding domain-containing protein n=1 Tax=Lucifera butyrica TaxID=1351585 RepID=A0A498RB68_9FIRM|nr:ParA family protein [Lucifera butyrica]VBB08445.1 Hypothetical protein LUCI_3717 [Lucifera butyrica]VBB08479.1 Hypothetical protein LUCI_3751 [Lucifera butyrica]